MKALLIDKMGLDPQQARMAKSAGSAANASLARPSQGRSVFAQLIHNSLSEKNVPPDTEQPAEVKNAQPSNLAKVPAERGGAPAAVGDRYFEPWQAPSVFRPAAEIQRSEAQDAFLMAHGFAGSVTHGVNYSLRNNAGDWTGSFDAAGYPVMSTGYYERHGLEAPTSPDQSWAEDRGYVPDDASQRVEIAQLDRTNSEKGRQS